jgi:hypothetical protein
MIDSVVESSLINSEKVSSSTKTLSSFVGLSSFVPAELYALKCLMTVFLYTILLFAISIVFTCLKTHGGIDFSDFAGSKKAILLQVPDS